MTLWLKAFWGWLTQCPAVDYKNRPIPHDSEANTASPVQQVPNVAQQVSDSVTREVAVYWDYENCTIPIGPDLENMTQRVHDTAARYGTVKLLQAYARPRNIDVAKLSEALEKQGGTFIPCHNQYKGQKEVADMRMIADMLDDRMDTLHKAQYTTIIVISGDGDFIDTITKLRKRCFEVVVIAPSTRRSGLSPHASDFVKWQVVTGKRVSGQASGERRSMDKKAQKPMPEQKGIARKKKHDVVLLEDLKKFAPLIAYLCQKGSCGTKVARSIAGSALAHLLKADSALYERAGCKDFQSYLKQAESLHIITAGPIGKGTSISPWVMLQPALHSRFAMKQPAWFKSWSMKFT